MTVQQKSVALHALSDFSVKIRHDGTWYVFQPDVWVADDDTKSSPTQSETSPLGAIDVYWRQCTAKQVLKGTRNTQCLIRNQ